VACTSTTQTVTSPSAAKCGITATATPSSFSPAGGSGTLTVTTTRDCQWTVTAAGDWIQFGASTQGQGENSVPFKVVPNADPTTRKATISVGDQQVAISEDAAPCVFAVTPRSGSVGAAGGQNRVAVNASSSQCGWTARSNADWLVIADGAKGNGTGEVRYQVAATTGPARTGTLQVADAVVTVAQVSGCLYTISPASAGILTQGGGGSIRVASGAGCEWLATSQAPWIAITGGTAGTAVGTVTFAVDANAMGVPARSGTISVNDQLFTVSQAAGPPCVYRLGGASQEFPALPGGRWSFGVFTAPACGWTASSNAAWVAIDGAATAAGNGIVTFTISTNPPGSPARVAAITVAGGPTFTVIQDAEP
jgi:hypothetical protein